MIFVAIPIRFGTENKLLESDLLVFPTPKPCSMVSICLLVPRKKYPCFSYVPLLFLVDTNVLLQPRSSQISFATGAVIQY